MSPTEEAVIVSPVAHTVTSVHNEIDSILQKRIIRKAARTLWLSWQGILFQPLQNVTPSVILQLSENQAWRMPFWIKGQGEPIKLCAPNWNNCFSQGTIEVSSRHPACTSPTSWFTPVRQIPKDCDCREDWPPSLCTVCTKRINNPQGYLNHWHCP